MISKKEFTVALLLLSLLWSCKNTSKYKSSDDYAHYLSINEPVYDSIQKFVEVHREIEDIIDINNQYYLLEFHGYNEDTLDFILTTIHKKLLDNYYLSCPFFYNRDSSILILNNGCSDILNINNEALLSTIVNTRKNKSISFPYNPLIWKLSIVNHNQIIIDRMFVAKKAEKRDIKK